MTDIFDREILDSLEWSSSRATYRADMSPINISKQGEYKVWIDMTCGKEGCFNLVPHPRDCALAKCSRGKKSLGKWKRERVSSWSREGKRDHKWSNYHW